MNDPLRDNRIFPEEMQQKAPEVKENSSSSTWLWVLLLIIAIIVLVWFGYKHSQKKSQVDETSQQETVASPKEQKAAFESLQKASPALTTEEREVRINKLFGNTN